ncbi:type IV secretion system DNA-binding domain-containing protein [Candidatus Saccharibacteria bacterium]|nr:type IV secretion system DNA-binding domain-containing protein [Candidatus Saccharibacteria bacterium]MBH1972887.1 type IV secretion system DNA-binding domain-containing protein [Candidatus Saccharibacteria bacterium]MBH1991089.1 type IV secretion system DNA-binding domain-containing protein [Candidatus Saccharibacteria bacterium]
MELISWIFGLLLSWYVWLPIVLFLGYLTWKNYQRIDAVKAIESTLLILEIPKANDKSEMAAEQLFASLHGILRDKEELKLNGGIQEHLSFEIASVNGQIRFYVWVPKALQSFVEGQIYAQYPTVQIHEADEDYVSHEREHSVIYTSEITLTDSEFLPIKSFQSFEVDPLAGITGTLAKLESESTGSTPSSGEELWVQVLVRPIPDTWHKDSDNWVKSVKSGGSGAMTMLTGGEGFSMKWILSLLEALWKPPEQGAGGAPAPKEISERNKTRISEAEKKATKLGYQVKIRLAYLGEDTTIAKQRMQAIVGTFKQYNSTNLNGFRVSGASFKKEDLGQYRARLFIDKGFVLNIEEVASVFHLPHTNVETPNIVWASSKTAEPPAKLPIITGNAAIDENISAFGLTNFRGINHQFGMLNFDRSRHMYVIGQTGAGKTGTLSLLALSDIFHNHGYAIIDPHGDFAVDNMRFIPASRMKDVVYFNPADTAFPLGFNPLEVTDPSMKSNISSEVIGVMKRMFGESWGPRLEYILRYTILALLDRPETTMLDITRMLTDKKFRKETLSYCTDTVVMQFWTVEFASWNDKFVAEAVAPVLNKVGAFTANPVIRNIIGQPKSTFNIREIMDDGKILIVNLSKGLIGEDNASILGSFLVTKIQLAAMSRSDIPDIKDRRPFYLYVDEFQNFATDSFATILSEARKYALNLTVANQYISQMNETVRDAVFGNVGTMICFRVSADDAPILSKQFEPQFEANDLLQMHNRNFVINMVINGEKTPAFSARTLQLPPPQVDNTAHIIEHSRQLYSLPRAEVEKSISDVIQMPENLQKKPPQSSAQAKQWPVDPQNKPVVPAQPNKPRIIIENPSSSSQAEQGSSVTHSQQPQPPRLPQQQNTVANPPVALNPDGTPVKKKRTRSRKKKNPSAIQSDQTTQNSASSEVGNTELQRQQNTPTDEIPQAPRQHQQDSTVAPTIPHGASPHRREQPHTPAQASPHKPSPDPTKLRVDHTKVVPSTPPVDKKPLQPPQPPVATPQAPTPQQKPQDDGILRLR